MLFPTARKSSTYSPLNVNNFPFWSPSVQTIGDTNNFGKEHCVEPPDKLEELRRKSSFQTVFELLYHPHRSNSYLITYFHWLSQFSGSIINQIYNFGQFLLYKCFNNSVRCTDVITKNGIIKQWLIQAKMVILTPKCLKNSPGTYNWNRILHQIQNFHNTRTSKTIAYQGKPHQRFWAKPDQIMYCMFFKIVNCEQLLASLLSNK